MSCDKVVKFFFVYGNMEELGINKKPFDKFFWPKPVARYALAPLPESVPEPIRKAMQDTVRTFNAQVYGATATSARRTLEGIFKNLLPEDQRKSGLSLHKLIEMAKDHVNFSQPLDRLADAVRKGGNLGAHFDESREPDQSMALHIVELLDYLISYVYILPRKIQELEETMSSEPSGAGET